MIVLDQWTKWLVELRLPHQMAEAVFPGLNLTHVRNTGVAFGLLASEGGSGWLLTVLGLGALGAVVLYFWFAPSRDRWLLVALALVVGGAVGNLIDRVTSGARHRLHRTSTWARTTGPRSTSPTAPSRSASC